MNTLEQVTYQLVIVSISLRRLRSHAAWLQLTPDSEPRLSAPLCNPTSTTRLGTYYPNSLEPLCRPCQQLLKAADAAAQAVIDHGDVPAWCLPCGTFTWTPAPRPGVADDWVCWTCRDRLDRQAAAERAIAARAVDRVMDEYTALDADADAEEADL